MYLSGRSFGACLFFHCGCIHEHTVAEDRKALYLPFSQLYTGYGRGANAVYSHPGVNVQEYGYSVTYMSDMENVVHVDYVENNQGCR